MVFIGPNNSGKTSAMQALALGVIGLKRWNEKRSREEHAREASRRDRQPPRPRSHSIPDANLLWRGLHVRDVRRVDGQQRTSNIRIDLIVEGVTNDQSWTCGLEFDYANDESFYCRPLRRSDGKTPDRMPVPDAAGSVQIASCRRCPGLRLRKHVSMTVPSMFGSGKDVPPKCCATSAFGFAKDSRPCGNKLVKQIESLFGSKLRPPRYIAERGEIAMTYHEQGAELDLSSAGRGLQQTLLLLAYMYANPGTVLLLDEPDAHLEILRQRQIYRLLTDVARASGSQIIAASHSEVLLNEAADRDLVVAFVGQPHRINDRGSQVLKALREIGFDQYYQAEQTGWVLYLEGSTDLAIMQAFARRLRHERAIQVLGRPFVKYVGNQLTAVQNHYYGLREALPALRGVVLFDRLESGPLDISPVECLIWKHREIENYVCSRATLEEYASCIGVGVGGCCVGTTVRGGRSREASERDGPSH